MPTKKRTRQPKRGRRAPARQEEPAEQKLAHVLGEAA